MVTQAPTTATPVVTQAPTTATPVVTQAPTTATPVVTQAPTTATPVVTQAPTTATPEVTQPPVTVAPESTEATTKVVEKTKSPSKTKSTSTTPLTTEVPVIEDNVISIIEPTSSESADLDEFATFDDGEIALGSIDPPVNDSHLVEDEPEIILDIEIPLGNGSLPKTSESLPWRVYTFGTGLIALGWVFRKK
ncbi:hypothetical protein DWB64_09385 [Fusibacter sp. A1]|nr:hypothetical protein DWB64_09385 [Fusibacter sp. A1]